MDRLREEVEKFTSAKDNGVQNVTEEEKQAASRRAR
jgi:hypothetical protein